MYFCCLFLLYRVDRGEGGNVVGMIILDRELLFGFICIKLVRCFIWVKCFGFCVCFDCRRYIDFNFVFLELFNMCKNILNYNVLLFYIKFCVLICWFFW